MELRIGQINAQRCRAVVADINRVMDEEQIDILCVQEPYVYKGRVCGFGARNRRIIVPSFACPWVAVVLSSRFDEDIELFPLSGLDTEHCVCVKLRSRSLELYIINVYCQFSVPIDRFLGQLEGCLATVQSSNVIICMDSNARSVLWHSGGTDARGELVEDFIAANNLRVLNLPHNLTTYSGPTGESNIDVTLAGDFLAGVNLEWRISDKIATSDHNLIEFSIGHRQARRVDGGTSRTAAFDLKRADWNKLREKFVSSFTVEAMEELCQREVDSGAKCLENLITRLCEGVIPRRKNRYNSVPWWSKTLRDLRDEARKHKRQLARARRLRFGDEVTRCLQNYRMARNKYTKEIRKAKDDSWRNFVTEVGNRDPWGILHRIAKGRYRMGNEIGAVCLTDGRLTKSWEESVEALMDKFVPGDTLSGESRIHAAIRRENLTYQNMNMEPLITISEISLAIRKMRNKKAPGPDALNPEIWKVVWLCAPEVVLNIFNRCLQDGVFPVCWKFARIVVIPKDPRMDRLSTAAFRPVTLLNAISKLFERVVVDRVQREYVSLNLQSRSQFGFMKGRSTEDALVELKDTIQYSQEKYVVALFIDIVGAFDNLWWPIIINRLVRAGCSGKLVDIVKSYFKDRRVYIENRFCRIEKRVQRGCPQGSIIGPYAWNWCLDMLLKQFEEDFDANEIKAIAYADDVVFLMQGGSRTKLEHLGSEVSRRVTAWCEMCKLKISSSKTQAMLMKGALSQERMPRMVLEGKIVKYVRNCKYLGIILDDRLSFVLHAKHMREKLTKYITAIKRFAREDWGIGSNTLLVLYRTVFLPILTYGSLAWFGRAEHTLVRRHLWAAQRNALLAITGSYRTVSTGAMQVISGLLPADLEVVRSGIIRSISKGRNVTWRGFRCEMTLEDDSPQITLEDKKRVNSYVEGVWQEQWNLLDRGRETFKYLPEVNFTRDNPWFRPPRVVVQIITGYGRFRASLYRRGAVEDPDCPFCVRIHETTEHVLFDCSVYEELRYSLLREAREVPSTLISSRDRMERLTEYIRGVLQKRDMLLENA